MQCSWLNNICKIKANQVPQDANLDLNISLKDSDDNKSQLVFNLIEHLFVSSDDENTLVFPLFRHELNDQEDTWFLGSELMQKYLFVFDNTHRDERHENYMTIGIAKKTQHSYQGLIAQYDKSNALYSPSSDDSSLPIGAGEIDISNENRKNADQLKADIAKLTSEISNVNETIKLMNTQKDELVD